MSACRCPWLQSGNFPSQYLGLPLSLGATKKSDWNPVVVRMEMKLSTWKATQLSMGGRMTLIKAAMANLPLLLFNSEMPNINDQQDREVAKGLSLAREV